MSSARNTLLLAVTVAAIGTLAWINRPQHYRAPGDITNVAIFTGFRPYSTETIRSRKKIAHLTIPEGAGCDVVANEDGTVGETVDCTSSTDNGRQISEWCRPCFVRQLYNQVPPNKDPAQ